MKIIFIDVDGVLNNHLAFQMQRTSHAIDAECMARFADIVKKTDASIVISSTWRLYEDHLETLMGHFTKHGIADRVIGKTPEGRRRLSGGTPDSRRGAEIRRWLFENTPLFNEAGEAGDEPRFAIIDDDDDAACCGMDKFFFQTSEIVGLTQEIADKVIEYMNRTTE